jgi:uncharacterized integral membrane protein
METVKKQPDTDRVAGLLGEYAEKLRSLLEERREARTKGIRYVVLGSITVVLLVFVSFNYYSIDIGFFFSEPGRLSRSVVPIGYVLLLVIGSAAYVDRLTRLYSDAKTLKREIETASLKLVKVVRYASQALEHTEMSRGEELELELRLTDAESALDRARRVIGHDFDRPYQQTDSG